MSAVAAIGFLVGLNKGAFFGGSISGILLNTPGTPESAATTWDGYPLAEQGKGEKALKMALFSSVTGDAFATMVLVLVAAPLAAVALYMGPPEIFALICMAMTIIAGLGSGSMLRGLIAACMGLLIGSVGIESVSAMPRLTFGITALERGISLIPIGIGMLAFSEIILQLERKIIHGDTACSMFFSEKKEDRSITVKEYGSCVKTLIRSRFKLNSIIHAWYSRKYGFGIVGRRFRHSWYDTGTFDVRAKCPIYLFHIRQSDLGEYFFAGSRTAQFESLLPFGAGSFRYFVSGHYFHVHYGCLSFPVRRF